MKPRLMLLSALALFCTPPFAGAEDFPQRFERRTSLNHVVVVLYEDGRASYSDRTIRPDGAAPTFDSPAARWGWHEGNVLGAGAKGTAVAPRRAIWLMTKGVIDGAVREFRFDYYYRPEVLEEFDKTGIVKTLKRVRGGSAAAAPPKPKGNTPR